MKAVNANTPARTDHVLYDLPQSFGWYESLGSLCIAMEYCELGDLEDYLSSVPPLPEIQAQEITFQTLEGVRYMHENEFAQRDLKPAVRSQIPGFKAPRV